MNSGFYLRKKLLNHPNHPNHPVFRISYHMIGWISSIFLEIPVRIFFSTHSQRSSCFFNVKSDT